MGPSLTAEGCLTTDFSFYFSGLVFPDVVSICPPATLTGWAFEPPGGAEPLRQGDSRLSHLAGRSRYFGPGIGAGVAPVRAGTSAQLETA